MVSTVVNISTTEKDEPVTDLSKLSEPELQKKIRTVIAKATGRQKRCTLEAEQALLEKFGSLGAVSVERRFTVSVQLRPGTQPIHLTCSC